jgi:transposase
VQWPQGIEPIPLPAYSPELDPVEQVFRQVRARLSNQVFESLQQLEAAIIEVLREFWEKPQLVIRLTAYPWWVEGIQQIASLPS